MSVKTQTRRRRAQIDPKTLKKHSDLVKKHVDKLVILGEKVATDTGYRILGFSGKNIETFFEAFFPGAVSDLITHPKKDRVVRVLDGSGYVIIHKSGEIVDKRLHPGDEVILPAGIVYRFATADSESLALQVSQDSKYESRIQIVEKSDNTLVVSKDDLKPNERLVDNKIKSRQGSKAKQQQQHLSKERGRLTRVDLTEGVADTGVDNAGSLSHVMNIRPSFGRFDEEGAG